MQSEGSVVELDINEDVQELPFSAEDSIPLAENVTKISLPSKQVPDQTEVDGPNYKQAYASRKNVAEGMMDIALLTANANQLRFLITFNSESPTYYVSFVLIVTSLILQVAVGIALIFKRQLKNRGKRNKISRMNDFLVGGVFLITIINVFVASFTTTETKT